MTTPLSADCLRFQDPDPYDDHGLGDHLLWPATIPAPARYQLPRDRLRDNGTPDASVLWMRRSPPNSGGSTRRRLTWLTSTWRPPPSALDSRGAGDACGLGFPLLVAARWPASAVLALLAKAHRSHRTGTGPFGPCALAPVMMSRLAEESSESRPPDLTTMASLADLSSPAFDDHAPATTATLAVSPRFRRDCPRDNRASAASVPAAPAAAAVASDSLLPQPCGDATVSGGLQPVATFGLRRWRPGRCRRTPAASVKQV